MTVSTTLRLLITIGFLAVPITGCSAASEEPPPSAPVLTPETTKAKIADIVSQQGPMKPAGTPKTK
jgi:hypothetical protein